MYKLNKLIHTWSLIVNLLNKLNILMIQVIEGEMAHRLYKLYKYKHKQNSTLNYIYFYMTTWNNAAI